jgi:hypothetical protein
MINKISVIVLSAAMGMSSPVEAKQPSIEQQFDRAEKKLFVQESMETAKWQVHEILKQCKAEIGFNINGTEIAECLVGKKTNALKTVLKTNQKFIVEGIDREVAKDVLLWVYWDLFIHNPWEGSSRASASGDPIEARLKVISRIASSELQNETRASLEKNLVQELKRRAHAQHWGGDITEAVKDYKDLVTRYIKDSQRLHQARRIIDEALIEYIRAVIKDYPDPQDKVSASRRALKEIQLPESRQKAESIIRPVLTKI